MRDLEISLGINAEFLEMSRVYELIPCSNPEFSFASILKS